MDKKTIISAAALLALVPALTSCYEDFLDDYNYTAAYFASQKPLRTVIADRDMTIRVGVTIGGRREVDNNNYADFVIDPELLDGTALTMMPENYYTLEDPGKMRISNVNLPIADVTVSFTEAFYDDPAAAGKHYAIPFRVVSSSADSLLEGKNTSIVAVKFVNRWQGTYYVKGSVSIIGEDGDLSGTVTYSRNDLSTNLTRPLSTLTRTTSVRNGVANTAASGEKVLLTFNADGTVEASTADGGIAIAEGSGSWDDSGERMEISLSYIYEKAGIRYKVDETLYRRQDPLKDLVFEEW